MVRLTGQAVDAGYGANGDILKVYVHIDLKQNERRTVYVDQPSLGLAREYFVKPEGEKNKQLEAYRQLMVDVAEYFGAEPERARERMEKVLQFERRLALASAPREETRDANKLYNPVTLDQLEVGEGLPENWKSHVEAIIGVELADDEQVVVRNPQYLKDLAEIIKETKKCVVADYMLWRFAKSQLSKLDTKANDISFNYESIFSGAKQNEPRWKECAYEVGFSNYDRGLAIATFSMFLRKHFVESAKAKMKVMTGDVR